MEEESKNLKSLREFGTTYMKENLFKPKKEKIEVHYNKNHLQIGRKLDGSVYYIDLTEACRILLLGATRCMPLGTLVKTKYGFKKIQDCNEVLSYNFKNKKVENKKCLVHNSGKQRVWLIKTKFGEIKCSKNHKWLISRNGLILEVETENLYKTDKLLRVNGNSKWFNERKTIGF